ncbi:MAG TPA: pyridoxine 5'-phosphate synthase, partial [Candidatus Omnitrophota bacterium]|nr:pyridoxine 5'-phosphate synthase [Candidatus Omnitrophota bacterium]
MPKLGVNIDHVATVRQARRDIYPNPVDAAIACEKAGAHSIVAHLREDRRHINDKDVSALKKTVRTRFNLEMSIHPAIVEIACRIKPDQATLVPEKRQEITTEGGLDVVKNFTEIKKTVAALSARGICV